jgi:FtsP/CotA-like multicopper oxidase with cupredoxin domain
MAVGTALPFSPIAAERHTNPLKIPKLIDGVPGARRRCELDVAGGISNFLPDLPTPTLGINGAYLGPTIRARAGDRVTMRVKNNMAEPTALHWHGLHVPARFDGGPHQVIEPGKVWEPSFDIKQKASLCWYHSHMLEQTGEQVLRGLAGLFLIEDDESLALPLHRIMASMISRS